MIAVLDFLKTYEVLIYLLVGGVGIVYAFKMGAAIQELQAASFTLEKEEAQQKIRQSLTLVVLTFLFCVSIFILVTFVRPALPAMIVDKTNVSAEGGSQTETSDLTSSAAPAGTTSPNQGAVTKDGCIPDQIEWTFPKAGGEISGKVELRGTINVPNLGFYTYEYQMNNVGNWTTLAAGDAIKVDEVLGGSWNTGDLPSGDYLLRLVVRDSQNNLFPACVISVRIIASQ